MRLTEIFKNTEYGDSLFTADEISAVEKRVNNVDAGGGKK
jgi:hypothetical protein